MKGQGKLNLCTILKVCWCCLPKVIKISPSCRNYSVPKLAHFCLRHNAEFHCRFF